MGGLCIGELGSQGRGSTLDPAVGVLLVVGNVFSPESKFADNCKTQVVGRIPQTE